MKTKSRAVNGGAVDQQRGRVVKQALALQHKPDPLRNPQMPQHLVGCDRIGRRANRQSAIPGTRSPRWSVRPLPPPEKRPEWHCCANRAATCRTRRREAPEPRTAPTQARARFGAAGQTEGRRVRCRRWRAGTDRAQPAVPPDWSGRQRRAATPGSIRASAWAHDNHARVPPRPAGYPRRGAARPCRAQNGHPSFTVDNRRPRPRCSFPGLVGGRGASLSRPGTTCRRSEPLKAACTCNLPIDEIGGASGEAAD
jgi:hypothetical protein